VKSFFGGLPYVTIVFALLALSEAVPIIGVPLGILFTAWILFSNRSGRGSDVIDTEPPPDHYR
jgi:hypothetical protein